jgi:hypothetical protein
LHRRPLSPPSLLDSLRGWLRSAPSRLRTLAPRLRSLSSRFAALTAAAASRLRSLSLESVLRDTERLARRPSRLTLGVAAGTIVATAAVLAVVSGGSGSTAAAVSDQDQDTVRVPAPSAPAGHGAPDGTGSAAEAPVSRHAGPAAHASASPSRAAPSRAAPSRAARSRAASHAVARPAAPAKPYLIYDSVVPGSIPASQGTVATYADGPHPTPASEVAGRKSVLWISITGYDYKASVVDVEPGNATPAAAAKWAWHRLSASPSAVARIYTMISEWPAVKSAVASFPAQMQNRIHWWIANPTGVPHLVPGSDATQWYWGPKYDITTAAPGF